MKISQNKYFAVVFLIVYNVILLAQTPVVVPLDHNPVLRERRPTMLKSSMTVDTVSLPFFDDFSYYWRTPLPDKKFWIDDYVYINNHYPVLPRSNGVATFDALDADGNVYPNTAARFSADKLTSVPIDLDGLSEQDSVFISFFYQPQGTGDSPDPGDSLILQFKMPLDLPLISATPSVTSVTITPANITVQNGETQRFFAIVTTQGGADDAVIWSITGNNSELTIIADDGMLYVADNETAETLAITATSIFDDTVQGFADILLSEEPVESSIIEVTVTPFAPTVLKGQTQQFFAFVSVEGRGNTEVIWTMTGNASESTTITADGLLFVANDETAATLTVTATSYYDDTKTGSSVVTSPVERWNNVWRARLDSRDSIIKGRRVRFRSIEERTENSRNVFSISKFKNDTINFRDSLLFAQVLLPVKEEYLYKGFQFRFVNYVSLEQDRFNPGRAGGNVDHWHIDYVGLDANRGVHDTATYDMTIISPMKSLITGYQSIPWNQARFARLERMIEMTYRNNHEEGRGVFGIFDITDIWGSDNTRRSLQPGWDEVEAGEIFTYIRDITSPFEFTSADSALFEVRGHIRTYDPESPMNFRANDTVRFLQVFKDYFARDDGVPESGYGFSGYNAYDCAIAARYESFVPENIKAVMIYFNPTLGNISYQYRFRIAVWDDNNGQPGDLIYLSPDRDGIRPTTGQFTRYPFEIEVAVQRTYWIGIIQVTSGFLNIGFDRNYNDRGNLMYNTGADWRINTSSNNWRHDINDGTLMIRPVLGQMDEEELGDDVISSIKLPETHNSVMKLYPNPASQYIRIELDALENIIISDYQVEIYDISGRLHYSAQYTDEYIVINAFETGQYIVRLVNKKTGNTYVQKLVISL